MSTATNPRFPLASHPDVSAWLANSTFDFAMSLAQDAKRHGGALTQRQIDAAYRCIEKSQQSATARAQREATAPVADVSEIEKAFARAVEAGLHRPRLVLQGFKISRAPQTGANAGALYAKENGVYLGKFAQGKFMRSRDCDETTAAKLVEIATDPRKAALAHGLATGQCAVCARELTDPVSVARGIGPICAARFGW